MNTDLTLLPPCSVLLLCGGRGLRMGGRDKGLLPWHGRPLIAWLADMAHEVSNDVLISCNRHEDEYARYSRHCLSDGNDDFSGPLAGIRTGLAHCRHTQLLVLPCDAPKVTTEILNALRVHSSAHQNQAVMLQQAQQWQPLFSLWPSHLGPALDQAWLAGERSPLRFLLAQQAQALHYPVGDSRLVNINNPEQLHAICP
ncbi:molybdenum cofactor guanylyltransferase MobA [Paraperlucidibaca sp.]|uniref:molybdenum cofactor guanylyltransferase MobA n=1 Tax=Paraperlucidibaca sp. TaxID=2708021 RepID=UPI0039898FDB